MGAPLHYTLHMEELDRDLEEEYCDAIPDPTAAFIEFQEIAKLGGGAESARALLELNAGRRISRVELPAGYPYGPPRVEATDTDGDALAKRTQRADGIRRGEGAARTVKVGAWIFEYDAAGNLLRCYAAETEE